LWLSPFFSNFPEFGAAIAKRKPLRQMPERLSFLELVTGG
jgi:hypothetical protein